MSSKKMAARIRTFRKFRSRYRDKLFATPASDAGLAEPAVSTSITAFRFYPQRRDRCRAAPASPVFVQPQQVGGVLSATLPQQTGATHQQHAGNRLIKANHFNKGGIATYEDDLFVLPGVLVLVTRSSGRAVAEPAVIPVSIWWRSVAASASPPAPRHQRQNPPPHPVAPISCQHQTCPTCS